MLERKFVGFFKAIILPFCLMIIPCMTPANQFSDELMGLIKKDLSITFKCPEKEKLPVIFGAIALKWDFTVATEVYSYSSQPHGLSGVKDSLGRNPIHYATIMKDLFILKEILLKNNSDMDIVNMTDEDGLTPLHFAAGAGYYDISKFLLEYSGCTGTTLAKMTDRKGRSPLHYAAVSGSPGTVQLILDKLGRDGNKLLWVSERVSDNDDGENNLLCELFEYKYPGVLTPLHYALMRVKSPGVVKLLLKYSVEANKVFPLLPVVMINKEKSVEYFISLLVEAGIDINEIYNNGVNPLSVAVLFENEMATEFLIDLGVGVNTLMIGDCEWLINKGDEKKPGITVLDVACTVGNNNLAATLVAVGCAGMGLDAREFWSDYEKRISGSVSLLPRDFVKRSAGHSRFKGVINYSAKGQVRVPGIPM